MFVFEIPMNVSLLSGTILDSKITIKEAVLVLFQLVTFRIFQLITLHGIGIALFGVFTQLCEHTVP